MTVSTKALESAATINGSHTINQGSYNECRLIYCERPREGMEDTVPAVTDTGDLYWVTVGEDGAVKCVWEANNLIYDDLERFLIPDEDEDE